VVALPRLQYADLFRVLLPLMEADSILCTDGGAVYAALTSRAHIQHEVLLPVARVRGPYNIQNVNSYHGRLKDWMALPKDVATHHLPKYLAWFNLKEHRFENYSAEDHLIAALNMI
jgi:hypothetical protein